MRHEDKFEINRFDYHILKNRLDNLFPLDANSGAYGYYRVRSIYFDNIYDKALREKLDGVSRREKFRIRLYNYDPSFIKLEKKVKIAGLGRKETAAITANQVEKILYGDVEWMAVSNNHLIGEFYSKIILHQLKPSTIVDYRREAYTFVPGNVRITLDSDIRTAFGNTEFLNFDIPLVKSDNSSYAVLEVKYDEFIPDIVRLAVGLDSRRRGAYSKYALSRRYD
ncbi:MAG: polyphosphate polymerase domain-containing protein [Ruminococcaceae bacterium]|nr:polyphosphate polymerase domain-containing protein [Oscillospiraceae bacterium]